MKRNHAWLFAFTDLSFLLLISLSLIPAAPSGISLHFAEMDPPAVPQSDTLAPVEKETVWELQVLAATPERPAPFRLARIDSRSGMVVEEVTLDRHDLLPALRSLHDKRARPVLLPDKNSLSHDFIYAAGTLARVWTDGRRPTVVRPTAIGGEG